MINGTGDGEFSPEAYINREEAASLLLRIYYYMGGRGIEVGIQTETFADEDQISSWAKESVQEIAALSIMTGVADHEFDPRGTYSTEQTIITLYRVYKLLNQPNPRFPVELLLSM